MTNTSTKPTLPARLPLVDVAETLDCALATAWTLGTAGNFRVFRIGRLRFADRDSFANYCAILRGEPGERVAA